MFIFPIIVGVNFIICLEEEVSRNNIQRGYVRNRGTM